MKCYSYKQDYEIALNEYLPAHRYDANKTEAIKEIIKINEASGDKTSLMEFYEKKEKLAEMDVSSSVSVSADEGFIDKIMKFFGR